MSLKLINLEHVTPNGLRARYDLSHSTPGREGTTVTERLILDVWPGLPVKVSLDIPDCEAPTPDEALARLGSWLRRLADGLDQRGESIKLPLS